MKIFIRIISLFLSIAMYLSCVSAYAKASTIFHSLIEPVAQAKSCWCWAACAEMCGKSVCRTSTRTQYDVVQYVKGNQNNVTGTDLDCMVGSEYVAYFERKFEGDVDMGKLVTHIRDGEGVIAVLRNGTSLSLGHMVVVDYIQMDVMPASIKIGFIDPWDGIHHYCSYEDFCNGSFYNSYAVDLIIYAK